MHGVEGAGAYPRDRKEIGVLRRVAAASTGEVLAALAIVAIVGIGVALRLAGIERSLWEDEVDGGLFSQNPTVQLLTTAVAHFDSHPPMYYVVVQFLSQTLRMSPLASLRMPSLVAGTAAILVVYAIARLLLSRPPALVAAALVAISPMATWYSQEGRMYALTWLLVLASYLSVIAGARSTRGRAALAGAVHAALTALALWTDYSAALALLPQVVLIVVGPRRRLFLATWSLGWIAFLPWLPSVLSQLAVIRSQRFPGLGATAGTWRHVLSDVAGLEGGYASMGGTTSPILGGVLLALILVSGALVVWSVRRRSLQYAATAACLTAAPVLLAAAFVRAGVVAVLVPRVLGIVVFGIALLAAGAVHVVARSGVRGAGALAGIVAVGLLASTAAAEAGVVRKGTNEAHYDQFAATLTGGGRPGDLVIYYPVAYEYAVDAFLPDSSPLRQNAVGEWPVPVARADQEFAAWTAGHDRVWLVYDSRGTDIPRHDAWFRGHGYCRVAGSPDGPSGVIEYVAASSCPPG